MRVVFVTNMPAPYRIATLNRVAEQLGEEFLVIFCTRKEANRDWNVPPMSFQHLFLKENVYLKKDQTTFVHNNPDVRQHLKRFNPDVVITGGFNPTMLYAFLFCLFKKRKHICLTDSWQLLEDSLSGVHKLVRKIVYRFSASFICCSQKGKKYLQSFNIDPRSIFISPLTIDLNKFSTNKNFHTRQFDLLFSGRFVESKNPDFFIRVAEKLKQNNDNIKVCLMGDGPMRNKLLDQLNSLGINFTFAGFISQEELPGYYSSSKVFLFPTSFDAWGVVAHEALASGTPVMISPYAGCSDELVINEHDGYVLPLEEDLWAEYAIRILNDEVRWQAFSENAKKIASLFDHIAAAKSFVDACEFAFIKRHRK
ncbi:MAG TPA: glycosyltransferase family 4 protein [Chitinophagaceae bacterium]|nr:glycosyltransferase family 4 protein [Chitinophagaceae bacterium]